LTLLYLATQIRQTNRIARFDTTREVLGQFNDLNRLYATDSAVRGLLLKGGELSIEEDEQLYAFADMYCNALATAQIAFNDDQIDEALFGAVARDVQFQLNRWPNLRQPVERWLQNYPDLGRYNIFKAIDQP
jgi:hypothetical protein